MEPEPDKPEKEQRPELKPDIEVDEDHGKGSADIKADDKGLGGPDIKE